MQMQSWIKQCGITGLLSLALCAPAAGGTLYKWKTADGTVSYTDDLKRVPEQFREGAGKVRTSGLGSYARYTPNNAKAQQGHGERLAGRLERLRNFNAEPQGPQAFQVPLSQTVVRVSDRMSIAVPNGGLEASEPIVVEERRVRDPGNITTRHVTVVKQGDRVISVIRPKASHNGAEWGDEAELLPAID